MIKFEQVAEKDVWDGVVCSYPRASFISSWAWGEFQKASGFDFRYIGVYKNNLLIGALPISIVRAKRGDYLHLRHSPLIDWDDMELVNEVVIYLKELAKNESVWFVRSSPLMDEMDENKQLLKAFGFKRSLTHEVDAEHTLALDLTKSEEQLLTEMRKNTRYSIRKAEKLGVTVEIYNHTSKFDEFWKIFSDAVERNKWVAYSYDYLKEQFELFLKYDMSRLFLSKYEGEYISASIFTYYNGRSVYHHSGSLSATRDIPSTYLLQWEAIKYAKSIGMVEHNLWGVVDKDDTAHPWYGLSLFKWGFGGEERKMVHAHDLIVSPMAHATRLYEFIESKRNGY